MIQSETPPPKKNNGLATTRKRKPVPPLTFLGRGSYGCAIKPALPNLNNSGNWVQYPDNITKIFFDEKQGKNAVKSQTKIKNILQNDQHRINTYKVNNYDINNIDYQTRVQCFGNDPWKYPSKIYPVRLPDLGIDMGRFTEPLLKKYRDINIKKIIEQMNKIINQVKTINNSGYIHGDLREPNIMINPQTGDMTLIDFDWFHEKQEFFQKYFPSLGFYNNPPETLMMPVIILFYNQSKFPEYLHQVIKTYVGNEMINPKSKISKYISIHNQRMKHRGHLYADILLDADKITQIFYYTILAVRELFGAEIGDTANTEESKTLLKWNFLRLIDPSFDSYGVAFTLLDFIAQVYGRLMFRGEGNEERKIRIEHLRDQRLTNGGKKYRNEEIEVLADGLHTYVQYVLRPMGEDFLVFKGNFERIPIQEAARRSQRILDKINEKNINASSKELNRLSLLASHGLPVKGGRRNFQRKRFDKTRKH
jgi:hypothetical protein